MDNPTMVDVTVSGIQGAPSSLPVPPAFVHQPAATVVSSLARQVSRNNHALPTIPTSGVVLTMTLNNTVAGKHHGDCELCWDTSDDNWGPDRMDNSRADRWSENGIRIIISTTATASKRSTTTASTNTGTARTATTINDKADWIPDTRLLFIKCLIKCSIWTRGYKTQELICWIRTQGFKT